MSGRVQDKVALVTGAGSVGPGWGNGKASAALLAREGARVFAVDIDPGAVEETRRIIAEEGGECTAHVADVTKSDAVTAMIKACLDSYNRIDILHNNVGGSAPGGPVEMTEEVWDRQMAHNLKHVYLVCKYVLPVMEAQGNGAIVNMSSVAALSYTGAHHIAYAATKAAILRFSEAVAIQYAAKGVRCNTVVPGQMHTPLVEHRLARDRAGGDVERLIRDRNARVPMGHMGDAWDVAYAVLYLASDEAKYVTGTRIVVDGGLTLKSDGEWRAS
jgi:NAD(P)-dependent dehydrogenase (short-subunit alcohol dehydrogenase family)